MSVNASRTTFDKLFADVLKNSKFDQIMATAFDVETNVLTRDKDLKGIQVDLYNQGETGIRSAFAGSHSFNRITGITESSETHLLVGGGKISAPVTRFFKEAGLTVESIVDNFESLPDEAKRRLRGRTLSTMTMRRIESMEKKFGIKMTSTQPELAGLVNKVFGFQPNQLNIVIGHNVGRFDAVMVRGVEGFVGMGVQTAILDTQEIFQRMFPSLAASRSGALELDNIVQMMLYDKSSPTYATIKDPLRREGIASQRMDALAFYGVDDTPEVFKRVSAMFGGRSGVLAQAAHNARVDSLRSQAIIHAAMLSAEGSTSQADVWYQILAEAGIREHMSLRDKLSWQHKFDPASVSRFMNVGGYKGKVKDLFDVIGAGVTTVENTEIYSKKGMKQLFRKLGKTYGSEFMGTFVPAATALTNSIDNAVFILTGGNLSLGKLGDPGSFVSLPLQKGGSGMVTIGDKLKTVTNIAARSKGRLKNISWSQMFYQRITDRIGKGKIPTTANAAYSLPTLVEHAMDSVVWQHTTNRSTHTAKLGSLLGQHPSTMGASHTGLAQIQGGHAQVLLAGEASDPLTLNFLALQEGLSDRNIQLIGGVKSTKAGLQAAYAKIKTAEAGLVRALVDQGLSKHQAFEKIGEWTSGGMQLSLGDPRTAMTILSHRDFEKGASRQLGNIPLSHRLDLAGAGVPIGPSLVTKAWLNKKLDEHSFQGMVAVFDFHNLHDSRTIFGDAGSWIAPGSEHMFTKRQALGTIDIQNPSLQDLHLLSRYLDPEGNLKLDKDFRPLTDKEYIDVVVGQKGSRSKLLDQVFKDKSGATRRSLEQMIDSGASISSIILTETEAKLAFVSTKDLFSPTDSFLMGGVGAMRTTSHGVMGGAWGRALKKMGANVAISAENFEALRVMDMLTSHRISVARRYGAFEELLDFFNSKKKGFELVPSFTPGLKTLVMPSGVTKEEVYDFTNKWKAKLEADAKGNLDRVKLRRNKAITKQFDGITIGSRVLNWLSRKTGIGVAGVTGFYTDIYTRADAGSNINPLNKVSFNVGKLQLYGQGLRGRGIDPGTDYVYKYLHSQFEAKTGYTFNKGILSSGKLGELAPMFTGNVPSDALVLTRRGTKDFIDQFGGVHAYPPNVGGSHTILPGQMTGTVFDPTRSRAAYIDLGGVETLGGFNEGQLSTRYLPVPHLKHILGVDLEANGRIARDSLAGKVISAVRSYATEGSLDATATTMGVGQSVRDQLGGAYGAVMQAVHGKEGLAATLAEFDLDNSFSANLLQKSGVTVEGAARMKGSGLVEAFTADINARQLRRWAIATMGRKKAKEYMLRAWAGNEYAFIGADPMQKGGHALIHKVRPVRTLANKRNIDVSLDRFSIYNLNRDTDMDKIWLGMLGSDARSSFERQLMDYATDHNSYLQRLLNTPVSRVSAMLRVAKEELLKGEINLTADSLHRIIGMKSDASIGYTMGKHPLRLLDLAAQSGSAEEFSGLLTQAGFGTGFGSNVISPLMGLDRQARSAAPELYQAFIQGALSKGGTKDLIHNLTLDVAWAREMARAGKTVEETGSLMRSAFHDVYEALGDKDLVRSAGLEKFLGEYFGGQDYTPGNMGEVVGDAMNRAIHTQAALGHSPQDMMFQITKSTQPVLSSTGFAIAGGGDIAASLMDKAIQDESDRNAAKAATDGKKAAGLWEGFGQGYNKAKEGITEFIKSDRGKVALWGLGILGAFGAYKVLSGSEDELPPPPMQMPYPNVPMPPPPMVNQPTDQGPRNYPTMQNTRVARIGRYNPAPLPRSSTVRSYGPLKASQNANQINTSIQDDTSTMDRNTIARRMKRISNSDFVY